jgi:preprotein translocase subunit SecG
MYHLVMAVHIFACLAMILFVLLQTGRGAGLQMFGGGGDSLITTPGGSSFMKKFTAGLAVTFALTSLLMTVLQNRSTLSSVTSKFSDPQTPSSAPAAPAQTPPAPAAPSAPAAPAGK